jgi:hypothetical protein
MEAAAAGIRMQHRQLEPAAPFGRLHLHEACLKTTVHALVLSDHLVNFHFCIGQLSNWDFVIS